jgi:hypothetical protein
MIVAKTCFRVPSSERATPKMLMKTSGKVFRNLHVALLITGAIFSSGCKDRDEASASQVKAAAPILLFDGKGTSPGDVDAFKKILQSHNADFTTVNSSQLNAMTAEQLRNHRLLILPGGNFIRMGDSLAPNTATNIRNAVQNGLNYLGVCAGAFLAGNPNSKGLNLTGKNFRFYSAEDQGIRKAAVSIQIAGGPTRDHYWEDGPQLAGWGDVVAKYPDGSPAVVERSCGAVG